MFVLSASPLVLKERGLSEGQWPQLTREGPVINVQRQSRTLQQKQEKKTLIQ